MLWASRKGSCSTTSSSTVRRRSRETVCSGLLFAFISILQLMVLTSQRQLLRQRDHRFTSFEGANECFGIIKPAEDVLFACKLFLSNACYFLLRTSGRIGHCAASVHARKSEHVAASRYILLHAITFLHLSWCTKLNSMHTDSYSDHMRNGDAHMLTTLNRHGSR